MHHIASHHIASHRIASHGGITSRHIAYADDASVRVPCMECLIDACICSFAGLHAYVSVLVHVSACVQGQLSSIGRAQTAALGTYLRETYVEQYVSNIHVMGNMCAACGMGWDGMGWAGMGWDAM